MRNWYGMASPRVLKRDIVPRNALTLVAVPSRTYSCGQLRPQLSAAGLLNAY